MNSDLSSLGSSITIESQLKSVSSIGTKRVFNDEVEEALEDCDMLFVLFEYEKILGTANSIFNFFFTEQCQLQLDLY